MRTWAFCGLSERLHTVHAALGPEPLDEELSLREALGRGGLGCSPESPNPSGAGGLSGQPRGGYST